MAKPNCVATSRPATMADFFSLVLIGSAVAAPRSTHVRLKSGRIYVDKHGTVCNHALGRLLGVTPTVKLRLPLDVAIDLDRVAVLARLGALATAHTSSTFATPFMSKGASE